MTIGLLEAGAAVVAVDRDADVLAGIEREARARGAAERLRCALADLADGEAVERLVESMQGGPRVDTLVNCAGIGQETIRADFATRTIPFWEVGSDRWRTIFAVNAEAVFRLCRGFVTSMVREGFGRIVNVTTSLDTMIRPGMSPYGPSKAATEALSAIMAKDLAGTGVTVNVLVPGGPARTRMMPGVPEDKLIAPDVMVAPLLYLVSDEAKGVTGQRVRAAAFDGAIAPAAAMQQAAAPIAWPGLAGGAAVNTLPPAA
jgi:3-oxoacyl-[acyl-carrier protein] reductase